jgi:hypothetical protein
VEAILERLPLLPVDLATARAHAQVWAELATAGTLIGPYDRWLAAACVAHGLTMVTAPRCTPWRSKTPLTGTVSTRHAGAFLWGSSAPASAPALLSQARKNMSVSKAAMRLRSPPIPIDMVCRATACAKRR